MKVNHVIIYVEGPSDKLSMQTLFGSLISKAEEKGVKVEFLVLSSKGNETGGKSALINKGVGKAANALTNEPGLCVALLPDLYPELKGEPSKTPEELAETIKRKFMERVKEQGLISISDELSSRFRSYCFKHDLEVLLLAVPEFVAAHLGVASLEKNWIEPVENQDHDQPPKRVIEKIYSSHKKKYKDTYDAHAILARADLDLLVTRCPQCFKPFVEFIRGFTT